MESITVSTMCVCVFFLFLGYFNIKNKKHTSNVIASLHEVYEYGAEQVCSSTKKKNVWSVVAHSCRQSNQPADGLCICFCLDYYYLHRPFKFKQSLIASLAVNTANKGCSGLITNKNFSEMI